MKKFVLYYRSVLLLLATVGVVMEIVLYGANMLLYYTVLSNLLVTVFLAYLVQLMVTGQNERLTSPTVLRMKGGVTMAIIITFVIYHFMLAPRISPEKFYRFENMIVHYIVPLGFLCDTVLVDRSRMYRRYEPLFWTLVPLSYVGLALFNGFVTQLPVPDAPDSPFPYFFMNVPQYGWGYVLTHSVVIFLAYVLAGYLLVGIKAFTKPVFPIDK